MYTSQKWILMILLVNNKKSLKYKNKNFDDKLHLYKLYIHLLTILFIEL